MKGVKCCEVLNPGVHKGEACEPTQAIDITTLSCQYYRRVFGWCNRMARNLQDAEDLTQEAFIQIMRKVHTFRGEAALSTWPYRVVTNTVLLRLREKRLDQVPLDEILADVAGSMRAGAAVRAAGGILRDSNARIDLERAINRLPAGLKMALILHDVEHFMHSEIGEIMGWSIGCSKSELHKARRRLREMLGDSSENTVFASDAGQSEKNLKRLARKRRGVRLRDATNSKLEKGGHNIQITCGP